MLDTPNGALTTTTGKAAEMAEGEYRRLTCGACKAEFTQTGAGRSAQRCGICRDQKPPAPTNCKWCGEPIPNPRRGKEHCSRRCTERSRDGSTMTRAAYRESVRDGAAGCFTCEHCGKSAFRNLSTTNKANGLRNRFCSMACRVARAAFERPGAVCPVFFNRCRCCDRQWTSSTRRHYCGDDCVRTEANRRALESLREKHRTIGKVVHCDECGLPYCPLYGAKTGAVALCAPCAIIRRRRWKAQGGSNVQRAKRAGVPYRYFNERRVLERDRWTCQLCGIHTPKEARGSTRPDAPEFDHCIPLALGGPHHPENGQCLCRACNLRKADSWCQRSVTAAVGRGVQLPAGLDRSPQERASGDGCQMVGAALIEASVPA